MKKKVAFMSNGCQNNFGRPREIIASIPELTEVNYRENPDYLMVNFCAISAENIDAFKRMKDKIIHLKHVNPQLRVLAGGCIEGLDTKKDLSFADAIYHHQEEAVKFLQFLGYDSLPNPRPAIIYDGAFITIAQGCNRRCTFCKVHYLSHMQLTSRPLAEIITLVYTAIDQGIHNIYLSAENSTEYGCDIGTNLSELLETLFEINGIYHIDIAGLCADEISPKLLTQLQHPKVRQLQIEAQSFYNPIRKAMGLHKTRDEILAIFDILHNKAITSNFITGFTGSNVKEFNKELKLIRAHHLYFLTLSPYDDTEGVPSHQFYQKPSESELSYYRSAFLATVAAERQLLLDQLMTEASIEASVVTRVKNRYTLIPPNYALKIVAHDSSNFHQVGDVVHVKITGLDQLLSYSKQQEMLSIKNLPQNSVEYQEYADLLRNLQYFGDYDQIMKVKGTILTS